MKEGVNDQRLPSGILHTSDGTSFITIKQSCQNIYAIAVLSGNMYAGFIMAIFRVKRSPEVADEMHSERMQGFG